LVLGNGNTKAQKLGHPELVSGSYVMAILFPPKLQITKYFVILKELFCPFIVLTISKKLPTTPNLELLASQERNEIDGSEGVIITLRMIREYVSFERRPFVMISRCNEVRANNSCREFLVLLSAQKYISMYKLLDGY
tara:strand:- start:17884 stop:18294 length:411 start_codon:yes stop_codon:yes gene_type:complete